MIQLQEIPFELPEFEKEIQEMIIEEEFGNDYYGNLVIENYPNLEKIVVKNNSLRFLNSLKICNCEKLKTIETGYGACVFITNVFIESIPYEYSVIYIFLIFNHSKSEIIHSLKQQASIYQVFLINSTLVLTSSQTRRIGDW